MRRVLLVASSAGPDRMGTERPERLHALIDVVDALGQRGVDVLALAATTHGSGLRFEQNLARPEVLEFLRPAFVASLAPDLAMIEHHDVPCGSFEPLCEAEAAEARRRYDAVIERDRFTDTKPVVASDGTLVWRPAEPEYNSGPRRQSPLEEHREEMRQKWGVRSPSNPWGTWY